MPLPTPEQDAQRQKKNEIAIAAVSAQASTLPEVAAWREEKQKATVASKWGGSANWMKAADRAKAAPNLAALWPNALAAVVERASVEFTRLAALDSLILNGSEKEGERAREARDDARQKSRAWDSEISDLVKDALCAEFQRECVENLGLLMKKFEFATHKPGELVMLHAVNRNVFKYNPESNSKNKAAKLAYLASDEPAVIAFFEAWAAREENERQKLNFQRADLQQFLGGCIADILAGTTRVGGKMEIAKPLIQRTLSVLNPGNTAGDCDWTNLGTRVASDMKRSFASVGPAWDPLFDWFDPDFWVGVKGEVGAQSKLGRWTLNHLREAAKKNPRGEIAKDLCAQAWISLNRKEIEALETALPGVSEAFLPALAVNQGFSVQGDLTDISWSLKKPVAQWILPFLVRAGMPAEDSDLEKNGGEESPRAWIYANKKQCVAALMAANASLIGKKIAKEVKAASAATINAHSTESTQEGATSKKLAPAPKKRTHRI